MLRNANDAAGDFSVVSNYLVLADVGANCLVSSDHDLRLLQETRLV